MNEEKKDILKGRLIDYLDIISHRDPKAGKDKYACPICGSGMHGGPNSTGALNVIPNTNNTLWKCHSCKRSGDIFDLYAFVNNKDIGRDFPEILAGVEQDLGELPPQPFRREESSSSAPVKKAETMSEEERSFSRRAIKGSKGEAYLRSRGISDENIERFFGWDENRRSVIIFYPGSNFYVRRKINDSKENRYHFDKGSTIEAFSNVEDPSGIIFATEGQIDAISLLQAGAENVIACSDMKKINEAIEKMIDDGDHPRVIYVADRDHPEPGKENTGKEDAKKVDSFLIEKNVEHLIVYPPEGFKDSNDVLKKSENQLIKLVETWIDQLNSDDAPISPDLHEVTVSDYFESGLFDEDLKYFQKYRNRKTGFKEIDQYLTLYPGVASLTGATSLGKTSFCVQLADQLVERGEEVLYFSLEQKPIELVLKSLSRKYRESFRDRDEILDSVTNIQSNLEIRNGVTDRLLETIKGEYAQGSSRLHYIECDFTITAEEICNYVKAFIMRKKVLPIVIVDYLQIVSAPDGSHMDEREKVDTAIKLFKKLSKENELFILIVSNMSRATYREKLGEDSYKESGLIEYTCDYLFGLQLAVLDDDEFFLRVGPKGGAKETIKSEKQDMIESASQDIPKKIFFKSFKNRSGRKIFKSYMEYEPDFDFFIEKIESKVPKADNNKDIQTR